MSVTIDSELTGSATAPAAEPVTGAIDMNYGVEDTTSVNMTFYRNGRVVTIMVPAVSVANPQGTSFMSSPIPEDYRPVNDNLFFYITVVSDSVLSGGSVEIGTDGVIQIYFNHLTEAFPDALPGGWCAFSVTYLIEDPA